MDAPVLFLTACRDTEAKVRGLTMGAEDYVTKPFDTEELVARIRILLRRRRSRLPAPAPRLRVGRIELEEATREAWHGGEPVRLSAREFDLLRCLMANAGRILTKSQLMSHVWNSDLPGESGVVETYVYYLRRKLGDAEQVLIRTVRGVGYLM